jgi:hypothetical protein
MSLSTSSMLVSLKITQYSARKLDREASLDFCESKSATADSGNFNKVLIPKVHLQPIQRMVNSIRNYHYATTLPWEHRGADILPSKMYLTYIKEMGNLKTQFETLVDEFITDYPIIISQVQQQLGSLYRESDYLDVEVIRDKFSIGVDITPIPNVADFRIDLEHAEVEKLKSELGARLDAANNVAEQELFARMYTSVAKAVITLKEPGKIFRNTLILNMLELSRKAPLLNINDNADINEHSANLKSLCEKVDINELRNNEDINYRLACADDLELILTDIEEAYNRSAP